MPAGARLLKGDYAVLLGYKKSVDTRMKRDEVTEAISRLAEIRRSEEAAVRAHEYARSLLGHASSLLNGRQQAQEWIFAVSLYFAAATDAEGCCRFATLQALIEERRQRALAGASDEELFTPLIDYPRMLLDDIRALSVLPRNLVMEYAEEIRNMLADAC
jgi:hypothetical protein